MGKREPTVSAPAGGSGWRESQMIKTKRSAEQQVEDEADRRALNPVLSRQTIAESQAEPEFEENHKRLKADRLAREAKKLKAKWKAGMSTVNVAYCGNG
jgi:hypothetical protein